MNATAVTASLILVALAVIPAQAQMPGGEACKTEKISSNPKVDFQAAFDAADKRARAWQADVVIARLTHTSLGPIDAEGRSTNWHMVYWSPGKKHSNMITIANGTITCWWSPNPAGRLPELKPNFYKDVKKVLADAAAQGGAALMGEGYVPTAELSAGSQGRALWTVNYTHPDPQRRAALHVTFDGNTGQFIRAIK